MRGPKILVWSEMASAERAPAASRDRTKAAALRNATQPSRRGDANCQSVLDATMAADDLEDQAGRRRGAAGGGRSLNAETVGALAAASRSWRRLSSDADGLASRARCRVFGARPAAGADSQS